MSGAAVETTVQILKPRKKSGKITAWAPRALIEPHTLQGEWAKTHSLFAGISGISIEVDAKSGLKLEAPANGDPCAVVCAIKIGFDTLGLKYRVSPC